MKQKSTEGQPATPTRQCLECGRHFIPKKFNAILCGAYNCKYERQKKLKAEREKSGAKYIEFGGVMKCERCGKDTIRTAPSKKYCDNCRAIANKEQNKRYLQKKQKVKKTIKRKMYLKTCENCGEKFETPHKRQKLCSTQCSAKVRSQNKKTLVNTPLKRATNEFKSKIEFRKLILQRYNELKTQAEQEVEDFGTVLKMTAEHIVSIERIIKERKIKQSELIN